MILRQKEWFEVRKFHKPAICNKKIVLGVESCTFSYIVGFRLLPVLLMGVVTEKQFLYIYATPL